MFAESGYEYRNRCYCNVSACYGSAYCIIPDEMCIRDRVKAVEAVDQCVGTAVEAIKKADGVLFICADPVSYTHLDVYKRQALYYLVHVITLIQ